MRSSIIFILIVAVASLAVLIPSRLVSPGTNEITMVTWGMPFEDALFRDGFARGFEELNPGLTVKYQRHTSVTDKYNAWHIQQRGADVMRMGIDYYHAFVAKGMLTPLSEFINDPEIGLTPDEIADYFPAIWQQLQIEGEIYALPSDNAQYGLYYNRTLFDAYNTTHPDDPLTYPSADWTWSDLKRAATALNIKDLETGRTAQFGILFDLWAWPFLAFLHQAGGTEWDESKLTTLINSPAGVEALEFLDSIVPTDAPMKAQGLASTGAGPAELFKAGRLAILLDGSWRAPNIDLDAPHLDYAIAPLPHHKKAAVVSGSVLWAVSAHSKNKSAAWEMIKWMTTRAQSLRYWDTLRVAPPARLSVVRSAAFRQTNGFIDHHGVVRIRPMPAQRADDLALWLEYAVTPDPKTNEAPGFVPAALYQTDLQNKIAEALQATIRDGVPAQKALDKAAAATHEIIDRDRAAKSLTPISR